ncbi:polysaccharide deacetylase family protein [Nesterenkonia muleiensis]|uniref:polysaccharide deacetylase family protein n=1 Tax=Nesterenkonia muleiensis TaxID=2282648 RepID=UPI000E7176CA|nr:polysaccharide deacetylase family protein [Nesterenkonia muleiensis]
MCTSCADLSLGRRMFLGAAAAAGLTALSACGNGDPGAERPTSPSPSPASPTPRPTAPSPTPSETEQTSLEQVEESLDGRSPKQWGLDVTGVVTSFAASGNRAVLTLDACGGPAGSGYDERLIEVLRSTSTPATLFINKRWAQEHRSVTQELVGDPLFEIANHGTRHLPLSVTGRAAYGISGTANLRDAHAEIAQNQDYFRDTYGLELRRFRSGTAHADEVAVEMAQMLGVEVVNFSLNADAGATHSPSEVHAALAAVQPGDICIGHFNQPSSGTADGVASALEAAAERGIEWATLEQALPRP